MAKKIVKPAVDAAMFVLFLLLMEYHLLPNILHEWLGISVFVLFLLHNALNYKWYTVLFKGKYSAMRIIQTVLNVLFMMTMLLCMISALFVSKEIFAELNLQAGMFGRILHMKASAWTFVLMSIHLGLHFGMFVGMTKRFHLPSQFKTVMKWVFRTVVFAGAVDGIVIFGQRGFYEELFVAEVFRGNFAEKTAFAAVIYFLQSLSMSVTFAGIAYYAKKRGLLMQKIRKEKHNEKVH